MKKTLLIILAALCLIGLWGCSSKHDPEKPVTVYYKRADLTYGSSDSVIAPAIMEGFGHESDAQYLLAQYLLGTDDPQFAATFPDGTSLVSFRVDGLTAKVILTDQFAQLSGIDLSIASACIAQTVMSITGCREVIISADTATLDGSNFITLTSESYMLQDLSGDKNTN